MSESKSTETGEQIGINRDRLNLIEDQYRKMYEMQLESELVDTRLLQRISAQLIEQENIEALYETIINAAVSIMRSDFASLQIFIPEEGSQGKLKLITSKGFSAAMVELWEWVGTDSKSICSLAVDKGNRVISPDIRKSEYMAGSQDLETLLQAGIIAVQSTPLISRNGEIVGMLSTHWRLPHKPSERDFRLLDILVRQAADLIENKKTQTSLYRSELKLLAMNETLEQRVEERTASLVSYQQQLRSLAYQLSKSEVHERKRLAAFLHDNLGQVLAVGKMRLDLISNHDLPDHLTDSIDMLRGLINDAIGYTRELMSDLNPFPSVPKVGMKENIIWVAGKMKEFGLEVTLKDDGRPKILSEEIQILVNQSVRELLFNVMKHAGVNRAEIELSKRDGSIQMIIKDEGRGFKSEEQPVKPSDRGGFGLFNMQERMNWMGIKMKIISVPGEGTEVTLVIPVPDNERSLGDDEDRVQDRMGTVYGEMENSAKIRVLIADDHQMMRKGLCKLIGEEDDMVVIAEASNGQEAVELARTHAPDVIIMDINMPEIDGIEATRKIRKAKLPVRIIGLSFHEEEDVARSILEAGASVYLSKAEVFETLCATVRSEGLMLRVET